jgi:hypothetical protein
VYDKIGRGCGTFGAAFYMSDSIIQHNYTGTITDDATATAANILSGKTAYGSSGKITGTMTNNGAKTSSLNCGNSYTIPAGYHNGSGKVTANTLASQTSATASASTILKGYTAWVNGSKITGTYDNAFCAWDNGSSEFAYVIFGTNAVYSYSDFVNADSHYIYLHNDVLQPMYDMVSELRYYAAGYISLATFSNLTCLVTSTSSSVSTPASLHFGGGSTGSNVPMMYLNSTGLHLYDMPKQASRSPSSIESISPPRIYANTDKISFTSLTISYCIVMTTI